MQRKRIDSDRMYMDIAYVVAKRSSCLRRQVGAVLVVNKHIVSTGYNGAPKGVKSCLEKDTCMREGVVSGTKLEYCMAAHAEANAIAQAAYHGIATEGATIYTIFMPCSFCAKIIINAGIKEVVYEEEYADELGMTLLNEAGIVLRKMAKNETDGK
jgi:dCMP deaminase